jgi:hypothetical protein
MKPVALLLFAMAGAASAQPTPIAALATTTLDGTFAGEQLGSALAHGDFNGDGRVDLAIASGGPVTQLTIPTGQPLAVVFSASSLPANLSSNDLDGSNGFVIPQSSLAGNTVGPWGHALAAGDINGDGRDDLVLAYSGASAHPANDRVVVLYGRDSGFPPVLDATSLPAGAGLSIAALDPPGFSRSSFKLACGDINGDGFDDVIVGMLVTGNPDLSGYVVFGGAQLPSSVDPQTLNGNNGFVLGGIPVSTLDRELHVAAGDLNGDGIDDLALGVPQAALLRVLHGKPTWPALVAPLDFNAHPGFAFQVRLQSNIGMGRALAFVPDLNGDGRRELVVAAPSAEGARGEAYILFGFSGTAPAFQFDGVTATAVLGDSSNRTLGWSLAGTSRGLALGAALSDGSRGRVLLLPTRPAPWPAIIDGTALDSQGRWLIGDSAQPALRSGTALLALPADGGNAREHLVIGAPQNGQIGQGRGRVDLVPENAWPSTDEVFAHGFEEP